jgi:hypothetical protein
MAWAVLRSTRPSLIPAGSRGNTGSRTGQRGPVACAPQVQRYSWGLGRTSGLFARPAFDGATARRRARPALRIGFWVAVAARLCTPPGSQVRFRGLSHQKAPQEDGQEEAPQAAEEDEGAAA